MEMTRRNFAGMGVAGAVRLQRRMTFADHLYTDVDKVRMLCDEVKKRERDKLKDVEMLRTIVDMVYFPLMELMWPIFEKAVGLDSKTRYFTLGLLRIRDKLESRAYGSVSEFSRDLANMFTEQLGIGSVVDTTQLLAQMEGRPTQMDLEVREKRKLAKRITKAIQPGLEDALKKESELNGRPFEKELEKMDAMFFGNLLEGRGSVASVEEKTEERDENPAINNDAASEHPSQAETERADPTTEDIKPKDMGQNTEDIVMDKEAEAPVSHDKDVAVEKTQTNTVAPRQDTTSTDVASTNVVSEDQHVQPSTEAP
ncbi:nuA3 HAT complex component nto1, partial [Ascosphaera atra]